MKINWKKVIDCAIAILTAISGFLVGIGSAEACILFNKL